MCLSSLFPKFIRLHRCLIVERHYSPCVRNRKETHLWNFFRQIRLSGLDNKRNCLFVHRMHLLVRLMGSCFLRLNVFLSDKTKRYIVEKNGNRWSFNSELTFTSWPKMFQWWPNSIFLFCDAKALKLLSDRKRSVSSDD